MDADVIVVGGGPSGLTVANELGLAGVRVIVLERRTGVVESRAGTFLPRVLELFDARGVADRFIRKAKSLQKWPFLTGHIWSGLKPVEWRHLNSRYDFTLIMPQHLTEEVLLELCLENGVDARFGHEVAQVGETDEGVFVDIVSGGRNHRLTAKYLVGADGPRSTVRKCLDIPFEGTPATFTGVLGDVAIEFPFPGTTMKSVDNEYGWGLALHFGERQTRIGFVHAERRAAPKNEPVTLAEYTRCLREIFGTDFGVKELVWSSRFSDHMRIVPSFRHGRTFLVGESCRIHYPASGIGMNFCIQDAFNLAWKLAYAVKGQTSSSTLDTYDSERRPVALDLLRSVRSQCAIQFNFSRDGITFKRDFERRLMPLPDLNRQLGLELNGLETQYPSSPDSHPITGYRAPDADLVLTNGKLSRVAELLRAQKFILLDLSGTAAFEGLDFGTAPIEIIEAQAVRRSTEMLPVKAMLVRPDAYIAWATDGAPSAIEARREVSRWLTLSNGHTS